MTYLEQCNPNSLLESAGVQTINEQQGSSFKHSILVVGFLACRLQTSDAMHKLRLVRPWQAKHLG